MKQSEEAGASAGSPTRLHPSTLLFSSLGVARALVADLVPSSLRATAMGTFSTATGLALLPASVIAGALWQGVGPWAPFAYGAVTASLAALLLLLVPTKPATA